MPITPPTVTLVTSGTDPKTTTKAALEASVNTGLSDLATAVDGALTGKADTSSLGALATKDTVARVDMEPIAEQRLLGRGVSTGSGVPVEVGPATARALLQLGALATKDTVVSGEIGGVGAAGLSVLQSASPGAARNALSLGALATRDFVRSDEINGAGAAGQAVLQSASPGVARLVLQLGALATRDTVTNNLLATVAQNTLKGRVAAGTGPVQDLSPSQVRALMNASASSGRPGDNLGAYTISTSGNPDAAASLDASGVQTISGLGKCYVLNGAGTVAMRNPVPLFGDVVEITARVKRTLNSADPNNDAVLLYAAWLDADYAPVGTPTVIATISDLTVSSGVVTVSGKVSPLAVPGVVAPPAGAVYVAPYIQTYGSDAHTAIATLRTSEVTDLHMIEAADLSQIIADAEAATLAATAAAANVNRVVIDSWADVAAYTAGVGVGAIVVKYGATAWDGQGGEYALDPGDTTSVHAPPTVLVGIDGSRWKRATDAITGILPQRFGAVTGGAIDSRAALFAADAAAKAAGARLYVPRGLYLVGSTVTFTAPVEFESGAQIRPANGVSLSFTRGVTAPPEQIFDLSLGGSVTSAGLYNGSMSAMWFGMTMPAAGADATARNAVATANANAINDAMKLRGIVFVPESRPNRSTGWPVMSGICNFASANATLLGGGRTLINQYGTGKMWVVTAAYVDIDGFDIYGDRDTTGTTLANNLTDDVPIYLDTAAQPVIQNIGIRNCRFYNTYGCVWDAASGTAGNVPKQWFFREIEADLIRGRLFRIKDGNGSIEWTDVIGGHGSSLRNIATITNAGGGLLLVTTTTQHLFSPGERVSIAGTGGAYDDASPGLTISAIINAWAFTVPGTFAADYAPSGGQTPRAASYIADYDVPFIDLANNAGARFNNIVSFLGNSEEAYAPNELIPYVNQHGIDAVDCTSYSGKVFADHCGGHGLRDTGGFNLTMTMQAGYCGRAPVSLNASSLVTLYAEWIRGIPLANGGAADINGIEVDADCVGVSVLDGEIRQVTGDAIVFLGKACAAHNIQFEHIGGVLIEYGAAATGASDNLRCINNPTSGIYARVLNGGKAHVLNVMRADGSMGDLSWLAGGDVTLGAAGTGRRSWSDPLFAPALSLAGALAAATAAVTGALTAGSAAITGALTAASATVTGAFRGANFVTSASGGVTIADDGVHSFALGSQQCILAIVGQTAATSGVIWTRPHPSTPLISRLSGDASIEVATGVLAGTSGTDGVMTVSVHTDGNIYVQNRTGSSRKIGLAVLGAFT